MPRFTLSLHTGGPGGPHYDLLLEYGPALRTWRLHRPEFRRPQLVPRLPDHRRIYLRYQGPLSRGRGRVRRWDTGLFHPDVERPGLLLAGFHGRKLRTRLLLRELRRGGRRGPAQWILSDPTPPLRRLAASLRRALRKRGLPASLRGPGRRLRNLVERCLQGLPVNRREAVAVHRALPSSAPRLRAPAVALLRLLRPPLRKGFPRSKT